MGFVILPNQEGKIEYDGRLGARPEAATSEHNGRAQVNRHRAGVGTGRARRIDLDREAEPFIAPRISREIPGSNSRESPPWFLEGLSGRIKGEPEKGPLASPRSKCNSDQSIRLRTRSFSTSRPSVGSFDRLPRVLVVNR
jgi:hypothetical protein